MNHPSDNVRTEIRDRIAHVVIDRPDVLNALDTRTLSELGRVFESLGSDAGVDVVILTGAGERAFAAGADVGELVDLSESGGRRFAAHGQSIFDGIENLGKPVIAAVNGYALGGGCELAMACTLRIASDRAIFGQPEVGLGLIPGYGGSQRLPRLVGRGRALELLLTGESITAQEAWRIGLVNRVVPASDLETAAGELALRVRSNAPVAVRCCLEAVHRGLEMTLADGQSLEADLFGRCCSTEDMKEGTRAFLEKRVASFRGQ